MKTFHQELSELIDLDPNLNSVTRIALLKIAGRVDRLETVAATVVAAIPERVLSRPLGYDPDCDCVICQVHREEYHLKLGTTPERVLSRPLGYDPDCDCVICQVHRREYHLKLGTTPERVLSRPLGYDPDCDCVICQVHRREYHLKLGTTPEKSASNYRVDRTRLTRA